MSIETEIERISNNVSDTLTAVSEMGGTVADGATSDDMAASVRSIPIGAKIDDSASSDTTTYSSNKIDAIISTKVSYTLLWEQENVDSFDAQTVALDLSAYDAVRVEYAASALQSTIRITQDVRVGYSGILMFVSGYQNKIHTRTLTVNSDGVTFNGANASSSTTVDTSCIPTKIWGVKWGAIDDFSA